MGKVGTTTVYSHLKTQHPDLPVYHLHFMSDFWVNQKLPSLDPAFHVNIEVARQVQQALKEQPGKRIQIITMVREPMSREISDIFQNWKGLFGVSSVNDLTFSRLKEYLDAHDHEYVLNWFDTEFKAWTGFDIYSVPFNKEKGYSIYHTGKADILCMKTEAMSTCFRKAMREFTHLDIVPVRSSNTSESKEGKQLYSELMSQYEPSPGKLDALYNSKYVRHFYTESEIDAFRRKWSRAK
ncbi:MAG TPA: putative capsular polysaccharide synthesis family protein [Bacteroidia bacterium]|nr:putative capsular polysaccharide synthesis family protein [Bacteroidia bacterium]